MSDLAVKVLSPTPNAVDSLSELLIETVSHGGSVGFMHPLALEDARRFWASGLEAAAQGRRIILGAFDGELLVGTVSLVLDLSPNQLHRGDVVKMMTRVSHRGRGTARALMQALEREAVVRGRTLLVLDTATDGGAAGLYEGLGYSLTGEIPDFALKPHGGLTGTLIYWKRLTISSSSAEARN
jgi:hypothetical protein